MFTASKNQKIFAFVVYPEINLLDLTASFGTLVSLTMGAGFQNVVVAENTQPMPSDTPLKFIPDKTFGDVPQPTALMVLGGDARALKALDNPVLIEYVRSAARTAQIVGAIDSGALLLAAAGCLAGKQATTYWTLSTHLEKFGARYVRQPWVEDGRFITAAGISGAMDMGLYLLAKMKSRGDARFMQTMAEYDPAPPFGNIDWSAVSHAEVQSLGQIELKQKVFG